MARQTVCPDCGRVCNGQAGLARHANWAWNHPQAKRRTRRYRADQRKKQRDQRIARRRRRTASIKKDLAKHKKAQGVK
jgi:transcription initiation factor TFIIIB Brf1 subunit/transcription initiation factor TFIIB